MGLAGAVEIVVLTDFPLTRHNPEGGGAVVEAAAVQIVDLAVHPDLLAGEIGAVIEDDFLRAGSGGQGGGQGQGGAEQVGADIHHRLSVGTASVAPLLDPAA